MLTKCIQQSGTVAITLATESVTNYYEMSMT